jgi:type IV secretion system protein VirD4
VFLGRDPQDHHRPLWSSPEDSVGIVGPPRYGKTSGLIIPTVLVWDGPLVSTSTRGDIFAFAAARRRALAQPYGGRVHVYDPFGAEYPGTSVRWSPLAGCEDPAVCYRRVAAVTAATGHGVQDGDHWRAGAAGLLRAYFHAAALEHLPLAAVRRWLLRQEVDDAAAILRTSASPAAMWADDLEAARLIGDRERGSFYSMARNALEATAEPTVLRTCEATDLDVDEFLTTRSSLFIIGPSHHQQAIAPLLVGLVDSIAQRAAELAAASGGRLDPALLLALDEVANIAPIHSLPALVSEGGGRGIVTLWASQSLSQLRHRYGDEQQAGILTATTAKVIFGGLSNAQDLANISAWAGERREAQQSRPLGARPRPPDQLPPVSRGGQPAQRPDWDPTAATGGSVGWAYRPALPVDQIQLMPPFQAWLFYRSDRPLRVEARPAGLVPEFDQLRQS